jgi:hypothetical protein
LANALYVGGKPDVECVFVGPGVVQQQELISIFGPKLQQTVGVELVLALLKGQASLSRKALQVQFPERDG